MTRSGLRRRLLPFAVAALVLPLAACGARHQATPTSSAADSAAAVPADVRRVRVVLPQDGTLTADRSAAVTVDPERSSLVAAGTSGRVAQVLHREGSTVQAGETVVQLDTTNLALQVKNAQLALQTAQVNLQKSEASSKEGVTQAQVALQAAQAALTLAQKQADSGAQLYAAGGISATDLDGLNSQLAQARSAYQQAQDAVDRSQRANTEDLQLLRLQVDQARTQLQQAQTTLNEASITAPFTGQIADMRVAEGEFVGTGSAVFRLVSTETQLARFQVPPQDAQQLTQQGLVQVRYGGLDYAAQIVRSTTVPGSSRLVELTAQVYPSKVRIPTGAAAHIDYRVTLAHGQVLPAAALQTDNGTSTVLQVVDGVARQVPVQLLAEVGGQAAVKGLPAGAQVVYPLPSDLLPGAKVTVVGTSTQP